MPVGKRRLLSATWSRNDLERDRAPVAELGLRREVRASTSPLCPYSPSRPGRRGGLAGRPPRPLASCSASTRLDFSPVCTHQSRSTRRCFREIEARGATPCSRSALTGGGRTRAFQAKLGIDDHRCSSDFEPKGEVARAYGAYIEPSRAPPTAPSSWSTRTASSRWTYESPNPGEFPGANLIFDALAASRVTDLDSAPPIPADRAGRPRRAARGRRG